MLKIDYGEVIMGRSIAVCGIWAACAAIIIFGGSPWLGWITFVALFATERIY